MAWSRLAQRSTLTARTLAAATCPQRARLGRPRSSVRCMAAAASPPAYTVLQYDYIPDILEKRGPHREGHLAAAREKLAAGKLVMAGAAGDPVDWGLFIFKNSTREEIEDFVRTDPYVVNGLVTTWKIKPYMVAVGP